MTITPMFLNQLTVSWLGDDRWELVSELRYRSAKGMILVVPAGFVTDFDSTPRWLPITYALIHGDGAPAAVVHDYLYQTHVLSKSDSDDIFYEALVALGQPSWRAWTFYQGVNWGGASSYASGPSRLKINAAKESPRAS